MESSGFVAASKNFRGEAESSAPIARMYRNAGNSYKTKQERTEVGQIKKCNLPMCMFACRLVSREIVF